MDKLREIVSKMTPGPWDVDKPSRPLWRIRPPALLRDGCPTALEIRSMDEANIIGIVTLRNIADELLAVVDAARAAIPEMICTCNPTDDCSRCKLCDALSRLDDATKP